MLTPGELRMMQATIRQTFDGTALVLRAPTSTNTTGGWTPGTFGTVTVVPCAIAAPMGQESPVGGRIAVTSQIQVFLPTGTDVRARDRLAISVPLVLGTAVTSTTRTFEVSSVQRPMTWETARIAICTEVSGG